MMLPFRLRPVYKSYIWGGTRLIDEWGKTPESESLAESWELASHKDGDNVILDGSCANMTLSEAVKAHPEIVSQSFRSQDTFPLMVKLIDSRQPLSIQVHPDNEYAELHEGSRGKVESWYILAHEEGAHIYLGLKKSLTREELEAAIANNTLTELLNQIQVHDGDTFFIPAGTIHAIGSGVTLAEIQENSNITYRVYDYGRVGADGRPRELHVRKALDVANLEPVSLVPPGRTGDVIVSCEEFRVERVRTPYAGRTCGEGFRFVLCVGGECEFRCGDARYELVKGNNVYVPSDCEDEFTLEGDAELLVTSR